MQVGLAELVFLSCGDAHGLLGDATRRIAESLHLGCLGDALLLHGVGHAEDRVQRVADRLQTRVDDLVPLLQLRQTFARVLVHWVLLAVAPDGARVPGILELDRPEHASRSVGSLLFRLVLLKSLLATEGARRC